MTIRRLAAAAALGLATAQCNPTSSSIIGITDGGGGTGGGSVPTAVTVNDNIFAPATPTVRRNGQIRWTWRGVNEHSVTFDDGSQSQTTPKKSGTFTRRFTDNGIFTDYCSVHGRTVMSGTVTVRDSL